MAGLVCERAAGRQGHLRVLVLVALGAGMLPAGDAQAYTAGPPPPWAICMAASQANQAVLEASLSPANNATVQAGAPVAFAGHSEAPVTLQVASSPGLLATPDIDSGSPSSEPFSAGPPVIYAYSFVSTKASANPGTVYWQASFSDAGIAQCAGLQPQTYTTAVRTLTVLAPPVPPPAPAPPVPAPVAPLQVSFTARAGVRFAHGRLGYSVRCSLACTGNSSYEVLLVHRHAIVHLRGLDAAGIAVSIPSSTGGEERLTHTYRGRELHTLQSALRGHATIELKVTANLTPSPGGATTHASSVLALRH